MRRRMLVRLTLLVAVCSVGRPALPQTAEPETPLPPPVPVPLIQTAMEPMPGPDQLPIHVALPDPLMTRDGEKITSPDQWPARREQIKQILTWYATGLTPPPPARVTGTVVKTETVLDGTATYQLIKLSWDDHPDLGFHFALFTPAAGPGPFPTICQMSFSKTPGVDPLPLMPRRPEQGHGGDSLRHPLGIPEREDNPQEITIGRPAQTPAEVADKYRVILERGYALATWNYQDTGEDTIARNLDGSWAYYNTRFYPHYPGYDWGLCAGWAWALSRVVDYLVTVPEVDNSGLIATGASRLGKAALIAGAFEERIAISAPQITAGGGTGVYRYAGFDRTGGEGLTDMMRKYPNWFSPHLHAFRDQPERLPFDQHWFIALTAPRGFINLDGISDRNCSHVATRKSVEAATPVYELLDAPLPPEAHWCDHGHTVTDCDWTALMDYADRYFAARSR